MSYNLRRWLLLLLALPLAACGSPAELHGLVYQQPRTLDFSLTDTKGQPVRGSDLDGTVALVFWGYTFCPDVCPTTMTDFKQVKEQLGGAAKNVRFIMITVDPERDTQARLAKYVAAFDPSFIGLRGDAATIQQLSERYGIVAQRREVKGSSADYLIDHTALAFLVDKQGRIRTAYPLGTDVKLIAADVQVLLAE